MFDKKTSYNLQVWVQFFDDEWEISIWKIVIWWFSNDHSWSLLTKIRQNVQHFDDLFSTGIGPVNQKLPEGG